MDCRQSPLNLRFGKKEAESRKPVGHEADLWSMSPAVSHRLTWFIPSFPFISIPVIYLFQVELMFPLV